MPQKFIIAISNGEFRDPHTQNHPRMNVQGQQTNLSFSQKSTIWPSGRHISYFYGQIHNQDTWKPPERMLNNIEQTWVIKEKVDM